MFKLVKEKKLNENLDALRKVQDALTDAMRMVPEDELQEFLQNVIGAVRDIADDREIFIESKQLNEDEQNLVKMLKILFDNSTLSDARKIMQAKQIANALNIDEKQLVSECVHKDKELKKANKNLDKAKKLLDKKNKMIDKM